MMLWHGLSGMVGICMELVGLFMWAVDMELELTKGIWS